jgi:hypothetical protein
MIAMSREGYYTDREGKILEDFRKLSEVARAALSPQIDEEDT